MITSFDEDKKCTFYLVGVSHYCKPYTILYGKSATDFLTSCNCLSSGQLIEGLLSVSELISSIFYPKIFVPFSQSITEFTLIFLPLHLQDRKKVQPNLDTNRSCLYQGFKIKHGIE